MKLLIIIFLMNNKMNQEGHNLLNGLDINFFSLKKMKKSKLLESI
jgi:hypothetical protein